MSSISSRAKSMKRSTSQSLTRSGSSTNVEVALDSVAGEHVASRSVAPAYAIEESAGGRAGQQLFGAGGERISNYGEFLLRMRSGGRGRKEWKDINSTVQVAKVTRPPWCVGKFCDPGFDTKFARRNECHDQRSQFRLQVLQVHREGGS